MSKSAAYPMKFATYIVKYWVEAMGGSVPQSVVSMPLAKNMITASDSDAGMQVGQSALSNVAAASGDMVCNSESD